MRTNVPGGFFATRGNTLHGPYNSPVGSDADICASLYLQDGRVIEVVPRMYFLFPIILGVSVLCVMSAARLVTPSSGIRPPGRARLYIRQAGTTKAGQI